MALISKIRERVGLLVFIIAIAILSFLLMDVFSGPGSQGGGAQSLNAGAVNGTQVDYQEYQNRVQAATNNQQRTNPQMTDQQRMQISENTWNAYVKEILEKQEYEKLGINVTKEEMRDLLFSTNAHPELKRTPIFQNPDTKQFDPELVKNYVRTLNDDDGSNPQIADQRKSWTQFRNFIKTEHARKKYNNLIKKGIYVPTWYAEQASMNTGKKVDISYVMVPYTSVEDSEVSFDDNDLRSQLSANPARYKQAAASDIEYISFPIEASEEDKMRIEESMNNTIADFRKTKDDSVFVKLYSDGDFNPEYLTAAQLGPKGAEIMSASIGQVVGPYLEGNTYNAYKVLDRTNIADSVQCAHILKRVAPNADDSAAKKTIDSLYTVLTAGGDFEAAAVNHSDDQSNSENGGDLGWVKPRTMVKPFNDILFQKGRVGDVLKVKTQFGWHLIKVYDVKGSNPSAKVAFVSKNILPSTETSRNVYGVANEYAGKNNTLEAFRSAAAEQGLSVQSAPNLAQNAINIPGIGSNDDIASWAFGKNVGDVSNVFVMDDKCVVAAVTRKRQEGTATIEDVRTQLESAVINQKKAEKLKSQISGTDLNGIASSFGQEVKTASGVAFDGVNSTLGNEPKVQSVAVSLGVNETSEPIEGNRGVYVVKVNNVIDAPATTDYSSAKAKVANALRSRVDFGAMEAIKNASDVEDMRYSLKRF